MLRGWPMTVLITKHLSEVFEDQISGMTLSCSQKRTQLTKQVWTKPKLIIAQEARALCQLWK